MASGLVPINYQAVRIKAGDAETLGVSDTRKKKYEGAAVPHACVIIPLSHIVLICV